MLSFFPVEDLVKVVIFTMSVLLKEQHHILALIKNK